MKKLHIGLIGCGFIAPTHLAAWQKIEDVEVVALCDSSRIRAESLARKSGIRPVYDDYLEMFEKENLQIADIAAPIDAHVPIALAAAQKGLHVLCQKPFAPSMADAEKAVAACRAADVRLMIHQNFRFQPFAQHLYKMLSNATLGKIFYARIFHRLFFEVDKLPVAQLGHNTPDLKHLPYYLNDKRLLVLNMVIHHLDTARSLFGEPRRLYASLRHVDPVQRGENHAVLLLEYPDLDCYIEESWVTRGQELIGFRIEGEKGSVEITNDLFSYFQPDGSCERSSLASMFPGYTMATIDNYSFPLVQRHFVDCIRHHREPIISGEDNLKTLDLVFKAYEAAEKSQIVSI